MTSPGKGLKKADIHIHLIGSPDEGCYISKSLLNSPWAKLIAHRLGLDVLNPAGYVQRLVSDIRESPIDVGVILALDAICDEQGEVDAGTSLWDFLRRPFHTRKYLRPGLPDKKRVWCAG